ncbi:MULTISPECIES: pseudouridine synthase [Acinetobacter]|uniref:pseudouridine synthase n=1 Tax=Acinetobacter TaxID=469 RepID=UPI0018A2869D|nr:MULTISPECIES: pseudouridine synthase [Acinetobacter]MBF7689174.1 pseudouridine synthase [Acinetobacter pollinis]MBF7691836.1 pseudouridine synthase [Acinetobacter pollinis]MBF7698318.1 pseudouridine synthase [Acinetobacter pollinis]MBF7699941.1 pseudouridine synthase [Acinetobacter pollinis]WEV49569.1 pseudouridine synthase [Acinetobacter sp. ESL0695]
MKLTVLNKPFNVLSQFREDEKHPTLAEFITDPDLRVSGRLDHDSEGLLLLTDQGGLNQLITHPKNKQHKTYLAQVEGEISQEAIEKLKAGVVLKDGPTRPAEVRVVEEPTWLWERNPPIRYRASIPTTWVEIKISEGRNRQVRRMTAAVGFPTLRLIRTQIGSIDLIQLGLMPGEKRAIEPLFYPEYKAVVEKLKAPKKTSGKREDPKKRKQNKKREEVLVAIFKTDAQRPRRITNGTTRPNLKKGRSRK